jgi:hypothetical protein
VIFERYHDHQQGLESCGFDNLARSSFSVIPPPTAAPRGWRERRDVESGWFTGVTCVMRICRRYHDRWWSVFLHGEAMDGLKYLFSLGAITLDWNPKRRACHQGHLGQSSSAIQSIASRGLYSRTNTCIWNARTALLRRVPYTWPLLSLIGDCRSGE